MADEIRPVGLDRTIKPDKAVTKVSSPGVDRSRDNVAKGGDDEFIEQERVRSGGSPDSDDDTRPRSSPQGNEQPDTDDDDAPGPDESFHSAFGGIVAPGSVLRRMTPEQIRAIREAQQRSLVGTRDEMEEYVPPESEPWQPSETRRTTPDPGSGDERQRQEEQRDAIDSEGMESQVPDQGMNPALIEQARRRQVDLAALREEQDELQQQNADLERRLVTEEVLRGQHADAAGGETFVQGVSHDPQLVEHHNELVARYNAALEQRQQFRRQFERESERLGELGLIHPDDPRARADITYRWDETEPDKGVRGGVAGSEWYRGGGYRELSDPMASDFIAEVGQDAPQLRWWEPGYEPRFASQAYGERTGEVRDGEGESGVSNIEHSNLHSPVPETRPIRPPAPEFQYGGGEELNVLPDPRDPSNPYYDQVAHQYATHAEGRDDLPNIQWDDGWYIPRPNGTRHYIGASVKEAGEIIERPWELTGRPNVEYLSRLVLPTEDARDVPTHPWVDAVQQAGDHYLPDDAQRTFNPFRPVQQVRRWSGIPDEQKMQFRGVEFRGRTEDYTTGEVPLIGFKYGTTGSPLNPFGYLKGTYSYYGNPKEDYEERVHHATEVGSEFVGEGLKLVPGVGWLARATDIAEDAPDIYRTIEKYGPSWKSVAALGLGATIGIAASAPGNVRPLSQSWQRGIEQEGVAEAQQNLEYDLWRAHQEAEAARGRELAELQKMYGRSDVALPESDAALATERVKADIEAAQQAQPQEQATEQLSETQRLAQRAAAGEPIYSPRPGSLRPQMAEPIAEYNPELGYATFSRMPMARPDLDLQAQLYKGWSQTDSGIVHPTSQPSTLDYLTAAAGVLSAPAMAGGAVDSFSTQQGATSQEQAAVERSLEEAGVHSDFWQAFAVEQYQSSPAGETAQAAEQQGQAGAEQVEAGSAEADVFSSFEQADAVQTQPLAQSTRAVVDRPEPETITGPIAEFAREQWDAAQQRLQEGEQQRQAEREAQQQQQTAQQQAQVQAASQFESVAMQQPQAQPQEIAQAEQQAQTQPQEMAQVEQQPQAQPQEMAQVEQQPQTQPQAVAQEQQQAQPQAAAQEQQPIQVQPQIQQPQAQTPADMTPVDRDSLGAEQPAPETPLDALQELEQPQPQDQGETPGQEQEQPQEQEQTEAQQQVQQQQQEQAQQQVEQQLAIGETQQLEQTESESHKRMRIPWPDPEVAQLPSIPEKPKPPAGFARTIAHEERVKYSYDPAIGELQAQLLGISAPSVVGWDPTPPAADLRTVSRWEVTPADDRVDVEPSPEETPVPEEVKQQLEEAATNAGGPVAFEATIRVDHDLDSQETSVKLGKGRKGPVEANPDELDVTSGEDAPMDGLADIPDDALVGDSAADQSTNKYASLAGTLAAQRPAAESSGATLGTGRESGSGRYAALLDRLSRRQDQATGGRRARRGSSRRETLREKGGYELPQVVIEVDEFGAPPSRPRPPKLRRGPMGM